MKILVCDDSKTSRKWVQKILTDLGHDCIEAKNGSDALELFIEQEPDLILLDLHMPDLDGNKVAQKLRTSCVDFAKWVPIIFISSDDSDASIKFAIDSGGDDYLVKPIKPLVLEAKITAIRRIVAMRQNIIDFGQRLKDVNEKLFATNRLLSELSMQDPLTRLNNRRSLEEQLLRKVRSATRSKENMALLMLDVDFFKFYNDQYGHLAGDECLQKIAGCLQESVSRSEDFVARYGGEEFAIILPNTDEEGALRIANRINNFLQALNIKHELSDFKRVTLSIGIAALTPESPLDSNTILGLADEALYLAKKNGRNTIEFAKNISQDKQSVINYSATRH